MKLEDELAEERELLLEGNRSLKERAQAGNKKRRSAAN